MIQTKNLGAKDKFLFSGGFTLMELIICLVILGVLATLGISQYSTLREQTFDREAQYNLRLIDAGERIIRMEDTTNNPRRYIACGDTVAVNTNLRLSISTTRPAWNYLVAVAASGGNPAQVFCAQATRATGTVRRWRICDNTVDPQPFACVGATCP